MLKPAGHWMDSYFHLSIHFILIVFYCGGRGDRTNWSGRVRQATSSVMRVNLMILVNVQALNSILQTLTSTFPRYWAFTIHSYIHQDILLNSLGIIHASWRHG